MRWSSGALATGAAALLLAGCTGDHASPPAAPPAVATVNGEVIPASAIARDLEKVRRDGGSLALRSEEEVARVRRRYLEQRIEHVLLVQAAKAHHVEVASDEIDRALLRMRADYPSRSFEELLADRGIPLSELRTEIKGRLLIKHLLDEQVNARVAVTDDEVKKWYDAHPEEYTSPEKVHALQIVVKTQEEAERIAKALRHHQKFEDLARKYSLGPEAAQGGDLGWFTKTEMPPPIADACFKLGVGRTSKVVESPYGYHLFKVLERKKASHLDLDDALKKKIETELRRKKEQEAQDAFVAKLKASAKIVVDEKALAKVR